MVFSSPIFLFIFLPALTAAYYYADKKHRNSVLLAASLLFYSWGEPKNICLMLLSIMANYVFGVFVGAGRRKRKLFLTLSVCFNLTLLFVFKYLNFTAETVSRITGRGIALKHIALPIGISFYTFQIMSYVIDVYREKVSVQKNLLRLALYVSLFPQLIAGPIVRYSEIEGQLSERTVSWGKFRSGAVRFAAGFAKKILIADQLSGLVDACFSGSYPSVLLNWAGAIAYTLQIFFDFSGYSDMAIGLGCMFGFDFPENFNFPYISKTIREFWRRWHITLGAWFRDYLYIPLGGSRKGHMRTNLNYIIVFFLTGLWHGASWNFIVWGLYYAVFIIIEREGFGRMLEKLPEAVSHIYSLLVIVFGWVLFRAETLKSAGEYLRGMFAASGRDIPNFIFVMNRQYAFFLLIGILLSVPWPRFKALAGKNEKTLFVRDVSIILVFVLAIMSMVGSGYSPFLYFRF